MSEKITSKNLSYSSSLPPFLARLHAEVGGATGPDPVLAAQKRSRKKRSSSEEAEDEPLVVDEHGNSLDVHVEKDGTVTESDFKDREAVDDQGNDDMVEKREVESKSSIGTRKRKAGKVIGDTAAASHDGQGEADKRREKTSGTLKAGQKTAKAKKIKLSFDEDEG
ncbi:hypothetical protein AAL_04679 [Moelleriella libera RCEF 2490]|uniref:DUF4604 domain-containing protein n=1 Tax=Moelleriella libera RCEF 2490 TaxID=1081109 RepID=A0A168BLB1_9HYPO|nr:hypothetical protein AAL_04679 [Moelleriella libera RCEF 2490]